MPIRSFRVGPKKSLRLAECDWLPDIAIITGSNGAGKSSLLSLLRTVSSHSPGEKILYVGAYRPWRKAVLNKSSVLGLAFTYNQFLGETHIPHGNFGTPLQQYQGQLRDSDSSDEANSLVKITIARLQEKFKDYLASIYQSKGEIRKGEIGDPFDPVKRLVGRLLPYLSFHGVEEITANNLTILFRSSYVPELEPFDIDELSAGEKAIVSLFLPILEFQIEKIIGVAHHTSARTFLIDEPETHLHPALQADMLAYMRELTTTDNIQFIMASHSPSIIEAATPHELFMVLPWQEVENGNQFVPVADSFDRLTAIKELTGSAFAYSRGRPILFLEGENPRDTKKATDLGLLELIIPDIRGYVVVASHGKSQAIAQACAIRRALAEQGHVTTAFALVDHDYDGASYSWALPWPACMIENLLLNMTCVAKLLAPYIPRGAADERALNTHLRKILYSMEDDEVSRRQKAEAGPIVIRPSTNDTGEVGFDLNTAETTAKIAAAKANAKAAEIRTVVRKELEDGTAQLRFHGKTILRKLFDDKVSSHINNYTNFVYHLAQTVALDSKLPHMAAKSIQKIRRYFPPEISPFLRKEEIIEFCKAESINIAILKEWSKSQDDFYTECAPEASKNYAAERELIKLFSTLRSRGRHDLYGELRPLVVDCISK